MSISTARGLQKLNDRHRRAAQLIAQGMTFVEVSREVGCHPFYWGRLVTYSQVFQDYLYACRELSEQVYVRSVERRVAATIEQKLKGLLEKQEHRRERWREQSRRRKERSESEFKSDRNLTATAPQAALDQTVVETALPMGSPPSIAGGFQRPSLPRPIVLAVGQVVDRPQRRMQDSRGLSGRR